MRYVGRSAALLLAWVVLAIPLVGCSASKIKVHGKVTENGKLFTDENTLISLTFVPDETPIQQTYPAKFTHATGTYEVEVPAGKYRVSVQVGIAMKRPPQASPVYEINAPKELDVEINVKK